MPKGLISQTVVILFRARPEIGDLRPLLGDFTVLKESPAREHWEYSGPSLLVDYRKEVNGLVEIDVVDRPWPDGMGDPQDPEGATLFGAWAAGFMGPHTYPGNLSRAVRQAWQWEDAVGGVAEHTAFVRIRSSYSLGASPDAACLPSDYRPIPELEFVTSLASALLPHPQAICYFNPGGEVLMTKQKLDEWRRHAKDHGIPPLSVWTNPRLISLHAGWQINDLVGNAQFELPDLEMVYPVTSISRDGLDAWVLNTTLYLVKNGAVIKDGDTMDGPNGIVWQASSFKNGLGSPPRRVLRWFPLGVENIPEELLTETEEQKPEPNKAEGKPWWRFW